MQITHFDPLNTAVSRDGPADGERRIKICLVGDGGVGKTALVGRLLMGAPFPRRYIPTMGVVVQPIRRETNYGPVNLAVWDTSGQEQLGSLHEGYFAGSDAYAVVADLTLRNAHRSVLSWVRRVRAHSPNAVIVIVGTKADAATRGVSPEIARLGLPFWATSARTGANCEEPFKYLAREVCGFDDLDFAQ